MLNILIFDLFFFMMYFKDTWSFSCPLYLEQVSSIFANYFFFLRLFKITRIMNQDINQII